RAYDFMQSNLSDLWGKRAENIELSSPYEALILASIIEKETGLASERPLISGVFMNRLKKGMRLQTDPTVVYGLGDSYKGNITRKHLKTDTPYNTYTRKGLPPTPISMPGRAAIQAALNPEQTDAIYFVALGDGSGGHHFSKTLAEHNKAVKRYLKAIRQRG
ncbi:MAG: endolytic transglycosylase MltG, partial [Methylococcales bacterium]|nr:endolytic transglycosylase MltG [Methylococcales bacterium]